MTGIWTGMAAGILIAGICCLLYYRKKEAELLEHLQQMLEAAGNGTYEVSEISEEKLSLLENSFKRYLDSTRISEEWQREQRENIQKLISDLAHQTLTPVSNLKLYTGLLEEKYGEDGLIGTVSEETEKLDFLIRSLVKISRMENGIITVHPKRAALEELLAEVFARYRKLAEEKQITFVNGCADGEAIFDPKWTVEAVGNIVDNAIKYTPPGGKVTLQVQRYPFFACIDISDTGIGIAEEEIPKVFERFYRSSDVSELPGVGIGLYLARYMVELQRGYIRVRSEKGKGTVFSVFLPTEKKE